MKVSRVFVNNEPDQREGREVRDSVFYVSTYCNFAHRTKDGKPIAHECRIIPPAALKAEREDNIPLAIEIMQKAPVRMMRRGVRP